MFNCSITSIQSQQQNIEILNGMSGEDIFLESAILYYMQC